MSNAARVAKTDSAHLAMSPAAEPRREPPVRKLAASLAAAEYLASPPLTWRRIAGYLESWTSSIVIHVVLILFLALWSVATPQQAYQAPLVSSLSVKPPELATQRLDDRLTAASSDDFAPTSSLAVGTVGVTIAAQAEPELDRRAVENLPGSEVQLANVSLARLPAAELTSALGMQSPGDPSAAVEGYSGALDRLTQQLLLMLHRGKVLVVWVFDQSESMKDDQQMLKSRIERVYKEIGLTNPGDGDALLTAVTSYGAGSLEHTRRPTSDLAEIKAAIDEIPIDPSGKEMMCQAVINAANEYRKYGTQGQRQLAIVLVTDESGDDIERIEEAIAAAKSANCVVYTLGFEAAFGYRYAYLDWQHPVETGLSKRLQIHRGPETAFVEQLQTEGLWARHDWHASGFGPYEQVRMCRETGGTFFVLPNLEANLVGVAGERNRVYQLESMRPYLPDLVSRDEYLAARRANELHTSLGEIIGTLDPYRHQEVALTEYYALSKQQPAALYDAFRTQQKKALDLIAVYQAADRRIEQLEPLRAKEVSPRWQANFDLLRAQALAYQIRCIEYGAYLEAFMQNPKAVKDPKTTHWRVAHAARRITGQQTDELASRATNLLRQVASDHAGTPYASRAEWELGRGFGVDLVEHYHNPRVDEVEWPNP